MHTHTTHTHIICIYTYTKTYHFNYHQLSFFFRCITFSPQELPQNHVFLFFARLRWKRLHRLLPGSRIHVLYRGWQCGIRIFLLPGLQFLVTTRMTNYIFGCLIFFEMMRICHCYWEGATPKLYCRLSSLEFLRIQGWDDLESQMNHHEPEPILFSLVFFGWSLDFTTPR